jgi:hypothetical protein
MAPGVPKRDWRDTVAPPRQIGSPTRCRCSVSLPPSPRVGVYRLVCGSRGRSLGYCSAIEPFFCDCGSGLKFRPSPESVATNYMNALSFVSDCRNRLFRGNYLSTGAP